MPGNLQSHALDARQTGNSVDQIESNFPINLVRNLLGNWTEVDRDFPHSSAVKTLEQGYGAYGNGGAEPYRWVAAVKTTFPHNLPMHSNVSNALKGRFAELASRWKAAHAMTSSVTQMALDPSYQEIIGMGPQAVPLILAELRKGPDHWFWALRSITGQDPVAEESRGDMIEMTETWLDWGKKCGISS